MENIGLFTNYCYSDLHEFVPQSNGEEREKRDKYGVTNWRLTRHFYSEAAYHRIKAAYSNTDKLDVPFQKKKDKLDVQMYSKGLTEINRQK